MKLKIALCDDDAKALPVIAGAAESAFRNQGILTELQRFQSGAELLRSLGETRYQIVMLDIDMPGMDGIQVGKQIREMNLDTQIVFVSECENRVFESFEVRPLGFVRKSNFLNDISAVVQLYIKTCMKEQSGDSVEFATRTGLLTLRSKQIRYVEGNRNYQLLYLEGQEQPVEVKMTMEKLEEEMERHGFIRVHKGYLVNYLYIQRIHINQLTLSDGSVLPIGRSKMGEVKSKFLLLMGK